MSTLITILSACGLFFLAIVMQGGFAVFFNISAIAVTIGGTIAATFISFPLPRVLRVIGVLGNVFRRDIEASARLIDGIVGLAVKARQHSLLAIEEDMNKVNNRFLQLGIEMLVDGHPAELIQDVLTTEARFMQTRHLSGEQIFRTAGKYAPAFGLIGTLIGLIAMLKNLGSGNIESLGPAMAVALVTTFYGALMANLVLLPVAEKLHARTNEELLDINIVIEGVMLIQGGVNPRIIEKKLNAFLPPEWRETTIKKHQEAHSRKS